MIGNKRLMAREGIDAGRLWTGESGAREGRRKPRCMSPWMAGWRSGGGRRHGSRERAPGDRLLHETGVQTVMLTGDNRHTAEAVARQLGMDHGDRRGAAGGQGQRGGEAPGRR